MERIDFSRFGQNAGYIEELFNLYQSDPTLVDPNWARYFASLTGATYSGGNGSVVNGHSVNGASLADSRVAIGMARLVDAYRLRGHLRAKFNPVHGGVLELPLCPELDPEFHAISGNDSGVPVRVQDFAGGEALSCDAALKRLQRIYCGTIGYEFMHVRAPEEREWLRQKIEDSSIDFSPDQKRKILVKLIEAEHFEAELHRKFVGAKRFSLQGGDSLIPMLDQLFDKAASEQIKGVVIGMAHRGRLNVLANNLHKPVEGILSEFEDESANSVVGAGDVKYHMGFQSFTLRQGGNRLDLMLAPNPSHLEAVNPVVEGICRAQQDWQYSRNRTAVLPLLIHGDAAVIGQGVVWETINYSMIQGYRTGGTLHIVINNQVGFTTDPVEGRSSVYCTDPYKAVEAPVLHVNGEDVEACCRAVLLALEFRNRFKKDVIIDLYCYRKYGHNEGDDPGFTQPVLYAGLKEKRPVYEIYAEELAKGSIADGAFVASTIEKYRAEVDAAHQRAKANRPGQACPTFGRFKLVPKATKVTRNRLNEVAKLLSHSPDGFKINPKLLKILEKRVESVVEGQGIEWGLAEGLAYGTLLQEGVPVRLSGQDCGRGTFSHRHLLLSDIEEARKRHNVHAPLATDGARFEVYNSPLSEYGVLGFEFGYSSAAPRGLVCWEAQFGDFANGAQIIIDQFISSSEVKWSQFSGVTMLLPHGYEGQGPEHSSARLERFLQLCADGNMTVCYPSKAAQHFHMLRRQALSGIKRPLIVMTPKSLLRSPHAAATADELTEGGFQEIIVNDLQAAGKNAKKSDTPKVALLMSGKIFYDVMNFLETLEERIAVRLIRVEQLYPFPAGELEHALQLVESKHCLWIQEEPQNMGAWNFIRPYLEGLGLTPHYIGRTASASTAAGSAKRHTSEQMSILEGIREALKSNRSK